MPTIQLNSKTEWHGPATVRLKAGGGWWAGGLDLEYKQTHIVWKGRLRLRKIPTSNYLNYIINQ